MRIQPHQAIAVSARGGPASGWEGKGATRAPVKRNSVLAVITLLVIFIASFVLTPNTANLIPLCFFKYLSHLDCPGCGLTRSFISISHGNFIQALQFNLLGPFVYLYFLIYLIRHFLNLILSNGFNFSWHLSRKTSFFLITLLFAQWIYKLGTHFIS